MQFYGYIKRYTNTVRTAMVCGKGNRTWPFTAPTAWQVLYEEHALTIWKRELFPPSLELKNQDTAVQSLTDKVGEPICAFWSNSESTPLPLCHTAPENTSEIWVEWTQPPEANYRCHGSQWGGKGVLQSNQSLAVGFRLCWRDTEQMSQCHWCREQLESVGWAICRAIEMMETNDGDTTAQRWGDNGCFCTYFHLCCMVAR